MNSLAKVTQWATPGNTICADLSASCSGGGHGMRMASLELLGGSVPPQEVRKRWSCRFA